MTTLPHPFGHAEAEKPEGKPVREREKQPALTFERIVTVGSLLIALGGILSMVNGHERRLNNIEPTVNEMRGDIKVLLERTDPNRKH